MRTEWRKGFWAGYSSAVVGMGSGMVLTALAGCASLQEVAGGAAKGVAEVAPEALEELLSGNWVNALLTLGAGAVAGGAGWLGFKKLRRKKAWTVEDS